MLSLVAGASVRIDAVTGEALEHLTAGMDATVREAGASAICRLHQERIGVELRAPLAPGEVAWILAELRRRPDGAAGVSAS